MRVRLGVYLFRKVRETEILVLTNFIFALYIYISGVEPWSFEQHLGEAVFIPAGCPFQVRNLQVRYCDL